MKTSNKILLSTGLLLLSLFLAFTLYSRQFIAKNTNKRVVESGVKGQKVLMENYQTDTLYLRGINCLLDPNSKAVSVESDNEFLSYFNVKNYRGIYPFHEEKSGNEYYSFPATYTIGVKGKSNLVIIAKKHSYIYTEEKLNINNLTIKANNDVNVSIENDGESLIYEGKNNSSADISGNIIKADITCEYQASIDAMNINFETVSLNLSERSFLRIKGAKNISGIMEDQARLQTIFNCNLSDVKLFDRAKHTVESWD